MSTVRRPRRVRQSTALLENIYAKLRQNARCVSPWLSSESDQVCEFGANRELEISDFLCRSQQSPNELQMEGELEQRESRETALAKGQNLRLLVADESGYSTFYWTKRCLDLCIIDQHLLVYAKRQLLECGRATPRAQRLELQVLNAKWKTQHDWGLKGPFSEPSLFSN